MNILAKDIKPGDVILPPARELNLWMRQRCAEKNLPESALHLTVTEVYEGAPDKRGSWLIVSCDQTKEWIGDGRAFPFKFKARPQTPWPLVGRISC